MTSIIKKNFINLCVIFVVLFIVFSFFVHRYNKNPAHIVEEFYENGAQYQEIPELKEKVAYLNRAAGLQIDRAEVRDGDLRGIDYDPMYCAQDYPYSSSFVTISQTEGSARVQARHVYGNGTSVVTFSLLNKNGAWHIVDVDCSSK